MTWWMAVIEIWPLLGVVGGLMIRRHESSWHNWEWFFAIVLGPVGFLVGICFLNEPVAKRKKPLQPTHVRSLEAERAAGLVFTDGLLWPGYWKCERVNWHGIQTEFCTRLDAVESKKWRAAPNAKACGSSCLPSYSFEDLLKIKVEKEIEHA